MLALFFWLLPQSLAYATDGDRAALLLGQSLDDDVQDPTRFWALSLETAAGQYFGDNEQAYWRVSADGSWDSQIASNWRLRVMDRFDYYNSPEQRPINTLKNAYLSWNPSPQSSLDVGYLNLRQGVGSGYNPTDYFRVGAVRSVVSLNPESLRLSRQGSLLLQTQWLWDNGSFNAVLSPQIGSSNDENNTNAETRALFVGSVRMTPTFQPQAMVLLQSGQSPQLGLNLSTLISQSLTAHLEWSGGEQKSLLDLALGLSGPSQWNHRVAVGGNYTAANRLSLTLEYHWCSAALNSENWAKLSTTPDRYGIYRKYVLNAQDPPTQHNAYAFLTWPQVLHPKIDLSGLTRHDLVDHSWLLWSEIRWRLAHADLALQWTHRIGDPYSQYGIGTNKSNWQFLFQWYF